MNQKLIGWMTRGFIAVVLIIGSASVPYAGTETQTGSLLERDIGSISIYNTTAYDILNLLQNTRNIPISFIERDVKKNITINLENVSFKVLLDEIISKEPEYQYPGSNK